MKLAEIEVRTEAVPLTRPYTIAYKTVESVQLISLRLVTERGTVGLGSASPAPAVTGETLEAAEGALGDEHVQSLLDPFAALDARQVAERLSGAFHATPAAGAALDMALLDIWARERGRPLADALGRVHEALPTSITIGIKDEAATLDEAGEYLARGFRVLKVKLGHSVEEDIARLKRLRECVGDAVALRVDPNQGYGLDDLRRFLRETAALDLEFIEQPLKANLTALLLELPEADRRRLALDECLQTPKDALRCAQDPRPAGIFNIKLMKCGGIMPALEIAETAASAGIDLMWGCMDESRVSIAAALHAALACPATRYLDLDGSFDLARDFARGGFVLEDGVMRANDEPGLGAVFVA